MSDDRVKISADMMIVALIRLVDKYREDFGIVDEECLENQVHFENEFDHLVCAYQGHVIGPDQCGRPEHDYCSRCRQLKVDIENE